MAEDGDLKTFNAAKEIAHHRDLSLMINYMHATIQARTGSTSLKSHLEMTNKEKRLSQVKGLLAMIHADRDLVQLSRWRVRRKGETDWSKKNPTPEDKAANPLEDFDCDYKNLMIIKEKLMACEKDIIHADITPTLKDDFIAKRDIDGEEQWDLTDNFHEMMEELEDIYEELEGIMYINEIISTGLQQDEELTYKEQELAFIERVQDA